MNFRNIIYEKIGKVARITLNRPDVRNALNLELLSDMTGAIEQIYAEDSIGALILTGTDNVFSGGGDIDFLENELPKKSSREIYKVLKENYGKAALALRKLPFPVIAAINGPAVGAGFDICLNCDIRLAGASATMGSIWVRINTIPALGGMYLLPRIVGQGRAAELIFTGDIIDAKEAYRIGLVNRIVEDDRLQHKALALADRLAHNATGAIAIAKCGLERALDGTFHNEVDFGIRMQSQCIKMEDYKEGLRAFREKRKPLFTGN